MLLALTGDSVTSRGFFSTKKEEDVHSIIHIVSFLSILIPFTNLRAQTDWIQINNGLTDMNVRSIAIDPANSKTIYIGTRGGVFRSQVVEIHGVQLVLV